MSHLAKHWFALARSVQLKNKPLERTLLEKKVVIVRLNGTAYAFQESCPHRGAPLSQGRIHKNQLMCPYHGFLFDSSGKCTENPATQKPEKCRLQSFSCMEQDGLVWVALQPPNHLPPKLLSDNLYRTFWGESTIQAPLFECVENFLDATHTHYVHAGWIRFSAKRKPVKVEIKSLENQVEATYKNEGAASGWIQQLFGSDIQSSIGRFRAPSIVELDYVGKHFLRLRIVLLFVPTEKNHLAVQMVLFARHWLSPILFLLLKPLLLHVLRQDQHILRKTLPRRYMAQSDVLGPAIVEWYKTGKCTPSTREQTLYL